MDFSLETLPEDSKGLVRALDRLQRAIKRTLNTAFTFRSNSKFEIKTDSSKFPVFFPHKLDGTPQHVFLSYCRNETDDSPPAASPFVDWVADGGNVRIRGISGLTSGKIYTLRFLVFD